VIQRPEVLDYEVLMKKALAQAKRTRFRSALLLTR